MVLERECAQVLRKMLVNNTLVPSRTEEWNYNAVSAISKLMRDLYPPEKCHCGDKFIDAFETRLQAQKELVVTELKSLLLVKETANSILSSEESTLQPEARSLKHKIVELHLDLEREKQEFISLYIGFRALCAHLKGEKSPFQGIVVAGTMHHGFISNSEHVMRVCSNMPNSLKFNDIFVTRN